MFVMKSEVLRCTFHIDVGQKNSSVESFQVTKMYMAVSEKIWSKLLDITFRTIFYHTTHEHFFNHTTPKLAPE